MIEVIANSRLVAGLGALLLVTGCAGPATVGGSPDLLVSQANELPPPSRQDLLASNRPYLVGPFDKLEINVFGIPELDQEVQADASGRISIPLAGIIEAAGRTPSEIADLIAARLRGSYVRNPQVTVNLKETVSQVITVDGEVKEPGLYPVIGQMTLMRAVATAKGSTEFAKLNYVVVFRTVNGQRMAALYNLKAIRNGQYPDPEVFANDIVMVGESQARRIFKDVLQTAPALITPVIYLIR